MIEIKGDLIELAKAGEFDVIAHGCNCFNAQKSGIARQMVEAFQTNDPVRYKFESKSMLGDIRKLGNLESNVVYVGQGNMKKLSVVNCYTQFTFSRTEIVADYEAITLCMRKINNLFSGKKIGLPKIGCGLGGGNWLLVSNIIERELSNCDVTIVVKD